MVYSIGCVTFSYDYLSRRHEVLCEYRIRNTENQMGNLWNRSTFMYALISCWKRGTFLYGDTRRLVRLWVSTHHSSAVTYIRPHPSSPSILLFVSENASLQYSVVRKSCRFISCAVSRFTNGGNLQFRLFFIESLHCIAQHCTVLYCTILYCTELYSYKYTYLNLNTS